MKVRDSQRSKLYRSEDFLRFAVEPLMSLAECQSFTDRVIAWAQTYTPPAKGFPKRIMYWGKPEHVNVTDGRGRRMAAACGHTIKLPRWARHKWIILHEIAHTLQTEDPSHGRQFAAIYLDLVSRWMGKDTAAALRLSYRAHHVHWRAKKGG